jgi:hypothetical protein
LGAAVWYVVDGVQRFGCEGVYECGGSGAGL